MTAPDETPELEEAREIVAKTPNILQATNLMRQRSRLGLREAKELIVAALNERYGTYYVVTPRPELILYGPHAGLEAAQLANAHNPQPSQVILVVGREHDTPVAATRRFIEAFPGPDDYRTVRGLLDLLLQLRPDYREALQASHRFHLIEAARRQISASTPR